jgi:hypothetical protein
MYRAPPKRTPRVAAVLTQNHRNVLVVIDPWEVRVAMVAPIATIRIAFLRERPTAVATNRLWSWLRRAEVDVVPVTSTEPKAPRADLPELRRFAGTKHEQLVASALALAAQALTHTLHEQLVSQNRSRQTSVVADKSASSRDTGRLPVPHAE